MSSTLQHCPDCEEEYVAGVAACVECGGPLQSGPLLRFAAGATSAATEGTATAAPLDRLLVELPGLQADHAARALLAENIAVRLMCQGSVKDYAPGQQPSEPFAVTLPVSVYVAAAHLDTAQEVLASFQHDGGDVIGDQWSEVETEEPITDDGAASTEPVADSDSVPPTEPAAESTSLRTVMLLIVAGIVLFLLFAR